MLAYRLTARSPLAHEDEAMTGSLKPEQDGGGSDT